MLSIDTALNTTKEERKTVTNLLVAGFSEESIKRFLNCPLVTLARSLREKE